MHVSIEDTIPNCIHCFEPRLETVFFTGPGPDRHLRRILPLYAMFVVTSMGQSMIAPLLPQLHRAYGIEGGVAALLLVLPSVVTLLISPTLGKMGDRVGHQRLTVAAGVLVTVSLFAHATPSIVALFLARTAFGVGFAAIWTCGMARLADTEPSRSKRQLTAALTSSAVGYAVAPALSGYLASSDGLAAPFVAVGVGALAAAAWSARTRSATYEPRSSVRGPRSALPRMPGADVIAVLRQPVVAAGAVALAAVGGIWTLMLLLVPMQLHADGRSTEAIGLVLSTGSTVFIIANSAVLRSGSWMCSVRVTGWLTLLLGLAVVPALKGSGIVPVVTALVGVAILRSVVTVAGYALATAGRDVDGPGPGAVMGVVNVVCSLTSVTMPLTTGYLTGSVGLVYATAPSVVLIVATGAVMIWCAARSPSRSGAQQASRIELRTVRRPSRTSTARVSCRHGRGAGRQLLGGPAHDGGNDLGEFGDRAVPGVGQ